MAVGEENGDRPALRAVVFDVDGTLAETEETHRQAFNETFTAAGTGWHWDTDLYRALLATGGGKERIRAFLRHHRPDEDARISDAAIAALHQAKTTRYRELVAGGALSLRPGVGETIAAVAAAGLRLAIATTTSRANLIELFDRLMPPAMLDHFDAVICGEDVRRKKPDPEVYEKAVSGLGLPPAACLAVEDHAIGLRAARAAGLPTLVVPSLYTTGSDFAGAAAVVADLAGVTVADLRGWHRAAPPA